MYERQEKGERYNRMTVWQMNLDTPLGYLYCNECWTRTCPWTYPFIHPLVVPRIKEKLGHWGRWGSSIVTRAVPAGLWGDRDNTSQRCCLLLLSIYSLNPGPTLLPLASKFFPPLSLKPLGWQWQALEFRKNKKCAWSFFLSSLLFQLLYVGVLGLVWDSTWQVGRKRTWQPWTSAA